MKLVLEYLNGQNPTEWVHPPTAKLLIAGPVYFLGYHAWAWRLAPALCGVALAFVFYLLARRALDSERAAVLATVLLLCDGVYLVQSRIAMTNIFAILFQLSAALFAVRAATASRLPARDVIPLGLALGLALSTRWTSLWAWGFLGLVLLVSHGRRLLNLRALGLLVLAFGLLPLVLYVASYVPWLAQGHALADLWPHQKAIWRYHADLVATHPYFSKWYTWPWLYRTSLKTNNDSGSTENIISGAST